MALDRRTIAAVPKVLLHDHLDGGLRPRTVVELAVDTGYRDLPTSDPGELGEWFRRGARRRSLERYLETFAHTVGVLQTGDAIERVAAECVEDLAADGAVYAEVRFAPELLTRRGLSLDDVLRAALEGLRTGSVGRPISARLLVTAMRERSRSLEVAEAAIRHREEGVVGFDLAGAERGHPASRHAAAFRLVHRAGLGRTVHAGESDGLSSIRSALADCAADRLGHGVRIVDDIATDPDGAPRLGPLAAQVRDRQVPLELCPTSNADTGAVERFDLHPLPLLRDLGFRVTVNTDNRLMSGVSLSDEWHRCCDAFGFGLADLRALTLAALDSAFCTRDERERLRTEVVTPAFAALEATADGP